MASSWLSAWHVVGVGKHVLSEGWVSTAAGAGVEWAGGERGWTQGKSPTPREGKKVPAANGAKPEAPPGNRVSGLQPEVAFLLNDASLCCRRKGACRHRTSPQGSGQADAAST